VVKLLRIVAVKITGVEPAGFESPKVTNVGHIDVLFPRFKRFGVMFNGMSDTYSVQVHQGHVDVTVPAELVRAKGWEKGQGLEWEIVGDDKRAVLKEGSDLKLQHAQGRYSVTMPILKFLFNNVTADGDYQVTWRVNEDGNLEMKKYEEEA